MTSIEWLASQLGEHIIWEEKIINLVEQAKEMHKQEIKKAYDCGHDDYANFNYKAENSEEYYSLIYGINRK
jgi:hypothetical protein